MQRWEIWFHRCFGMLVLSLGVWFAADRAIPVEQVATAIVNGPVHAGQDALVQSTVNRLRSCPARVERAVFDDTGLRFKFEDLHFTRAGPLGVDTYGQLLRIPSAASPGVGRVQFVISWVCNPLHWLVPITVEINMPVEIIP